MRSFLPHACRSSSSLRPKAGCARHLKKPFRKSILSLSFCRLPYVLPVRSKRAFYDAGLGWTRFSGEHTAPPSRHGFGSTSPFEPKLTSNGSSSVSDRKYKWDLLRGSGQSVYVAAIVEQNSPTDACIALALALQQATRSRRLRKLRLYPQFFDPLVQQQHKIEEALRLFIVDLLFGVSDPINWKAPEPHARKIAVLVALDWVGVSCANTGTAAATVKTWVC